MINPRYRLYSRLAWQMAPRFRWPIWRNYWRYRRTVAGVRRDGPDGLAYAPPNVGLWVTNRCNKDCHFCQYIDGLNAKDHRELELTFERFKELVHLPMVRNCLRLGLYGGEPLLNQALPEMIRYGKQQGHLVTVITNGLLIKKRLAALLESPPDLISISYYPEDSAKTDEAISLTALHIPVIVNYMLSAGRLGEAEAVVESAVRNRAWAVKFDVYDPQGTGGDCELPQGVAEPTPAKPVRTRQEIPIRVEDPRLVRLRSELDAKYGKQLLMMWPQAPPPGPAGAATCRAFWHSTWLDARGQMSPCCVWPITAFAGSVLDGSAGWNSTRMIALREAMRRNVYPRICSTCSHLQGDPLGI